MKDYTTYSDVQLLALLHKNDERAFQQIYYRYREPMARFACSITKSADDAHDILQDVFTYVWTHRDHLQTGTSLKSYLSTAVRHRSLRQLENHARRGKLQQVIIEQIEQVLQPLEIIEAKQTSEQVSTLISHMPERMQQVIMLSRDAQLSHREIGEQLNITESTVKKQVQNALRIIRGGLQQVSGSASLFIYFLLK